VLAGMPHALRLTLTNGKTEEIQLPEGTPPDDLLKEFLAAEETFPSEWIQVVPMEERYIHRSAVVSVELVEAGSPSVTVIP
jgi:hypothetical protein